LHNNSTTKTRPTFQPILVPIDALLYKKEAKGVMICYGLHATYTYFIYLPPAHSIRQPIQYSLLSSIKLIYNLIPFSIPFFLGCADRGFQSLLEQPHPTPGVHIRITMEPFFIILAVIFVPVLVFLLYILINGERYVEVHKKYIKYGLL
jgi:hypothetical protein